METSVDFLPERVRTGRVRKMRFIRQVKLLLLAGATFAAWLYFSDRRVRGAMAEMKLLKDRSANVQALLDQREELQKEQAALLVKERIVSRLGSRAGALDVLSELERLLPAGVSLTSLNMDTVQVTSSAELVRDHTVVAPAAAPKEAVANRLNIVLTGIAPADVDVATFIGQLTASPLFEDVNMGYTRNKVVNERLAREFQVSFNVVR